MFDFFAKLAELVASVLTMIKQTTASIDSIQFEETLFHDYLGYFHYVVGSPSYELFITILMIAVGMSIWSFLLKGIGLLKNILPW